MSARGKGARAKGRAAEARAVKPQLTLVQGAPVATGISHYLTVPEVASMLRLTPKGIYKMVHEKRIPFRKAGAQLLFDQREIDEWTKTGASKG